MKRILTAAVLAAALAGCGQTIHFGEPQVAETNLRLPAPEANCSLSQVHPLDRDLLQEQARIQRGSNYVLGMFADCKELIAWREGRDGLGQYGSFLSPVNTHGRQLPMERGDFVAEVAKQFTDSDPFAAAADRVRQRVEEAEMFVELGETVPLGLLGTDELGAYIGVLQRVSDEYGQTYDIVAVTGMTLVQRQVVSVNLWAPYEGQRSVDQLLNQQRNALRRLVDANRG